MILPGDMVSILVDYVIDNFPALVIKI